MRNEPTHSVLYDLYHDKFQLVKSAILRNFDFNILHVQNKLQTVLYPTTSKMVSEVSEFKLHNGDIPSTNLIFEKA